MKVPSRVAACCRQLVAVTIYLVLCSLLTTVHAGMRGRGEYLGVVVFDRWDTCFLLSGPYVTYISEAVKEKLRPYAGQAIQIDATEILQPMNPGDALVKAYAILGDPPDGHDDSIAKIEIEVRSAFDGENSPIFDVTLRNASVEKAGVSPSAVGLTLLGINQGMLFSASDGKSVAWITRADLEPRNTDQIAKSSWSSAVDGKTIAYAKYNAMQPCAFKSFVELAAD